MLHYRRHHHHHHQAVAATSASSDLSSSESWSTCGGTGGSSYIINSSKYVRAQQQQQSTASSAEALERMIVRLASENAVVIFSNTSCCMCHAVKSLLCGMGVNPTVYELDQLVDPTLAKHIERALLTLVLANYQHPPTTTTTAAAAAAGVAPVPVVFIGGKLLGPMDRVMASHINGTLVPLLKQAGALWL